MTFKSNIYEGISQNLDLLIWQYYYDVIYLAILNCTYAIVLVILDWNQWNQT